MRNIFLRSLACISLLTMLAPAHAQTTARIAPLGKGLNPDMLVSKWKTDNMVYDLKKDGISMVTISGRECPGTWALKGNKVTIIPKRWRWKKADPCSQPHTLEVVNVNAQGMDIADPITEKEIHLAKMQ